MALTPTHIVIHHSLTSDSKTVSWDAIRKYHKTVNGWSDIGYHYGIELVGDHMEIFIGRMADEKGAHCPQLGMNSKALGVCVVGNFDIETPSVEVWEYCKHFVRYLMRHHNIPVGNVIGHVEANPLKSCPGKNWNMIKFRNEI